MPKNPRRTKNAPTPRSDEGTAVAHDLRIIGGRFRGSRLEYGAHAGADGLITRPMKHRVREAIFNLVGTEMPGKLVLDLFAGTGALGLEAISRGAERAFFIEKHIPSAAIIKQNIASLGLKEQCELKTTSAMLWAKRDLPSFETDQPWCVFFSPPYQFFVDRTEEMLSMITALRQKAPPESLLVVEADERFDFNLLEGGVKASRHDHGWDVRAYTPAVVGVWRT